MDRLNKKNLDGINICFKRSNARYKVHTRGINKKVLTKIKFHENNPSLHKMHTDIDIYEGDILSIKAYDDTFSYLARVVFEKSEKLA